MHHFSELIVNCTKFTLRTLEEVNEILVSSSKENASTVSVKGLQMLQLQKSIFATGMFSLFEAELQRALSTNNGFDEAKKILTENGDIGLMARFEHFKLAINVLKHGHGRSYNILVESVDSLPFNLKMPREYFFDEGDISEVSTLVEVDDEFLLSCAQLISDVSKAIKSET